MICSRIGPNLIRVFLSPEQACALTLSAPLQGLRGRASSPSYPQGSQKDPRFLLAWSHPYLPQPTFYLLPEVLKLRWACSQLQMSLCTQQGCHNDDLCQGGRSWR